MSKWISTRRWALCSGVLFTVVAAVAADTPSTPPTVVSEAPPAVPSPAVPSVAGTAPARLPYGVDDVLKLSRAQVNEDIIQNYIQNSGTIYNLSPNDIVYLRNQGVSDRIVTAMLDQRKRVTEATAQTTPTLPAAPAPAQAPVTVPSYADAATAAAAPTYNDVPPAPVEVQPSSSSLYVIPYPQATAPVYRSYISPYYYGPYWGGYWGGYCGPTLSLGLGFGGGWGHGGWYGGYRGGYHGGYRGGYHGGYRGGFHGHR